MSLAAPVYLVSDRGDVLSRGEVWCGDATVEEMTMLERVLAPVIDIGCGPARHVMALAARGIPVMGIDAAPSAVALARRKGAAVLERSVFGSVPGCGRWGTALLLDGNIGIGGDPETLLRRVHQLLRAEGRLLMETAAPGSTTRSFRARVETGCGATTWFPWASVDASDVARLAALSGYELEEIWERGDRWFGSLRALSSSD